MFRSGYTNLSETLSSSVSCFTVTGVLAVVGTTLLMLLTVHNQELYAPIKFTETAQGTTTFRTATARLSTNLAPSALPVEAVAAETPRHPLPQISAQATHAVPRVLGLGCVLAGLAALAGRWMQATSGPRTETDLVMVALDGEGETEAAAPQGKRIEGVKARPAGYRHDVSRGYQLEEVMRPRRNRRHPALRALMRETHMSPANFIMPLFIHDEEVDTPINAMPGCNRLCAASVLREVGECVELGVSMFILFPKVSDELKTPDGRQSYDPGDIVMRTIKLIKGAFPDVIVCTDIALDPYNTDGHDGIVDEYTGVILNDITVEQLCKQAVAQARAGTDIVAPSDMQDGRIGAIRDALDSEGFTHVGIMSYCAKYASAFYGPFREALDSNPSFGDKSTYQMDPANRREALREIELDEAEGADLLMVKPALPYLDIILTLKENSALPIAAYQVSGEYSMIKSAGAQGFIDEQKVALESLLSIRRAGADVIVTYFAKDASKWMADPEGWWQKRVTGRL